MFNCQGRILSGLNGPDVDEFCSANVDSQLIEYVKRITPEGSHNYNCSALLSNFTIVTLEQSVLIGPRTLTRITPNDAIAILNGIILSKPHYFISQQYTKGQSLIDLP